jgi:predicted hotdog family 3-hydroxylacyl-ACP dehydratase
MLIDKPGIARLIPHAGDMCLLDGVRIWNDARIECVTATHLAPDHPMRRDGRLGTLCGVEYAAQAMALHAALTGGGTNTPRRGYLASLRALSCHVDRLDLMPGLLVVEARHEFGDAGRAVYHFSVSHQDRILLSGRAAVVLEQIPP